jgi:four helix bundle protein
MGPDELKKRTKHFGLRIIRLVESLPSNKVATTIGNQLLQCGTSVGANYRSACRGRSKPDFIAKVGIAIEEADEIIAILTSSVKTARSSLSKN